MGIVHSFIDNSKPYQDLKKVLDDLNSGYVKSGFPEGKEPGAATRSKANAKPYDNMSEVARVAAWNEFGTRTIPSRPFFRTAIDGSREKIFEKVSQFADLALVGKKTVDQAFELLGLFMQGIIRASIRSNIQPPNTLKTIAAKRGSTRTLIDSGQMINSVTFVKVQGKK